MGSTLLVLPPGGDSAFTAGALGCSALLGNSFGSILVFFISFLSRKGRAGGSRGRLEAL